MSASLKAWLDPVDCNELIVPLNELGVKDTADLKLLDDEDIEGLCAKLKKIQAKKFRQKITELGGGIPAGDPKPQTLAKSPSGLGQGAAQGARIAGSSHTGHLTPMNSLVSRFRPLLEKPAPRFLDAMRSIADANIIPYVMQEAELTLQTARDQKQFGQLKGDPLSEDGIAFIMKYTAGRP